MKNTELIDGDIVDYVKQVTFVIPVFNGEMSISRTIESVSRLGNYRIIVIDDGSTDNTSLLVESLGIECFRIANSGAYNARAYGVSLVLSEFTVLLDADDLLIGDFSHALAFLDQCKSAIAVIGSYISTGSHFAKRNSQNISKLNLNTIINRQFGYAPMSASIWRTAGLTKAIQDLIPPMALRKSDDYELFIRALMHGEILTCDHLIMNYSMVGGKSTLNFEESVQSSIDIAMYYGKIIGLEVLPLKKKTKIALATFRRLQILLYSNGRLKVYLHLLMSMTDLYYYLVARNYIRNNQS